MLEISYPADTNAAIRITIQEWNRPHASLLVILARAVLASAMNKKFLLLASIAITGFSVLFLLPARSAAPPPILSGFLNFTNLPTGPAARFSITNYPWSAIMPRIFSVALLENNQWKSIERDPKSWPPLTLSIGGQVGVIYTLPVPTTNVPVRIVMEIRTQPTGLRATAQRFAVWAGRSPRQWHVPLPALYFTNETTCAESKDL